MKNVFRILLFSIAIYNICYSQSRSYVFLQDQNRLKFGNYLFNDKDYLRAIDEYSAYLKSNINDTLSFKIGYAQLQMGNMDESRMTFEKLFSSQNLSDLSKSYYLHSFFIKRDFSQFENLSSSMSFLDKIEEDNLEKKLAVTDLLLSKNLDETHILTPFKNENKQIVQGLFNRVANPKYKSGAWAGVMSAVIPGSGKMYAGKISDGIVSFLLTGLFTYLAIDNFNKDRNTRAWIFSGTAAFFYAGNIYGSVAATQIYNAGIRFNFENDVELFLKKENYFLSQPEFLKQK